MTEPAQSAADPLAPAAPAAPTSFGDPVAAVTQPAVTETAAAAAPSPAPAAATPAEVGQVVRYAYTGLGDLKHTGYGLVLEVTTVDEETGGHPQDGKPTCSAYLCAELPLVGRRLRDEDLQVG
jgi:hypothetical protein